LPLGVRGAEDPDAAAVVLVLVRPRIAEPAGRRLADPYVGPADDADAALRVEGDMGVSFMTAKGASVAEVARSVGYGSSRAFSRALGDAGLPSPSRIAEVVRALA
jgi:hypothetical protein